MCAGFVLMALLVEVSRDPGELAGVGVDWGKAVWAALREVEEGVQGSHGASSPFAEVVRIKREEVVEELGKAGAEWVKGGKVEGLKEELEKVERVVEGLLAELKA